MPSCLYLLLVLTFCRAEPSIHERIGLNRHAVEESTEEILISLNLNLNAAGASGDDNNPSTSTVIEVRQGQCSHDSVIHFGVKHNIDSASLINLKQQLDTRAVREDISKQVSNHPIEKHNTLSKEILLKKATKELKKGQYLKAGRNLLHVATQSKPQSESEPNTSNTEQLHTMLSQIIEGSRLKKNLETMSCGQSSYSGTLERLSQLSPNSGDFPYLIASCYAEEEQYSLALQTTANVLKATGSKGKWKDTHARTKAVLLAHRMSLELGDIESASKKLSVALRADPNNCDSITSAFTKLKKIRKSVKSAKKDLKKTYNKRALGHLETAMELANVYNLTTNVLKGKLMLDLCLAMARVRRHEKALIVCNEAIDLTNITMDGLFMDTGQQASAFIARGESLVADYDYKEAVRDFRSAADIAGQGEIQDSAREKQRNAEWKSQEWEKNPDRIKILGLPVNIDSIAKKSKCEWLRKSFKKMVLKWHPDKNKGNPGRGSRKFDEVTAAKKWMSSHWGCSGRRRL